MGLNLLFQGEVRSVASLAWLCLVPQTKATMWLCNGTRHPSGAVSPLLLLWRSDAPGEGVQPQG